jgi:hypothetical protein
MEMGRQLAVARYNNILLGVSHIPNIFGKKIVFIFTECVAQYFMEPKDVEE